MIISIMGLVALVTSTISLIPQLYRTYQTKSAKDLSMGMLLNFVICSISWIVYGILLDATSVWITNIIMTICSLALVVMKILYRPQLEKE